MIEKIKDKIQWLIRFLTYDIWRINSNASDGSGKKIGLYNILKTFILAIRNINGLELNTRAAALTYKTLLSIVPLLAVLFAIARGFGFEDIAKSQLFSLFEGQKELLQKAMMLINSSLEYAQSGVFMGVGLVLLIYTVISLLSSIEDNFNTIWFLKKGRTYFRQFTDYLALIIIAPIFLICNAGLSVFLSLASEAYMIGIFVSPVVKVIPFVITIFLFTFLYVYLPNTKVKFSAALLAGIIVGVAFQIFQMVYINGQIWISKYHAIYGVFAALPLLLLWLQLSWFMCLFGVELSFAYQNVSKYNFEHETKNISRRYNDFVLLLITSLIIKRFEKGEKPYTADELSLQYEIPTKLTIDSLFFLQEVGIIIETPTEDALVSAYIPAIDINRISVSFLFGKIDLYGSEDFMIGETEEHAGEWHKILEIRESFAQMQSDVLVKDL